MPSQLESKVKPQAADTLSLILQNIFELTYPFFPDAQHVFSLLQFRKIFHNSKNCRYLDMVNERVIELKSIAQFVDAQAKLKEGR